MKTKMKMEIKMKPETNSEGSAVEFCQKAIKHFEEKANHNKNEALWFFMVIISSTLSVPMFITLGQGLLFGKILPSLLSLVAAGATSWLQLRKPQQLWATYRTAQRQLEDRYAKYRFKIAKYAENRDPDKMLAEDVAEIKLNTHQQWVSLIPNPDSLKGLRQMHSKIENQLAENRLDALKS